jgi:drug/metabolite transporter (DMT)-like permease
MDTVIIVALVLIWGTTWAAIRLGLEGVPPFTGAAIRFGISAVLMFSAAWLLRVRLGRRRHEVFLWVVNGVLLFFLSYGVVYWAEQWVPSGLAAVLFATFPLFVAIQAHFLLPGEQLTPRVLVGILVGFGGVATIYSEDFALLGGPDVAFASVVMLVSPIACAVANVLVKKLGSDIHPVSTTAVPMAVGALLLGATARLTERTAPIRFDALSVGCILYLAIFGSAVTFSLYFWMLRRHPATKLALIAYGTPVVAVFVGAVFLHEPLTPRVLAGTGGVLVGVALATWARERPT